jgi:hypothetical protein
LSSFSPKTQDYLQSALDKLNAGDKITDEERRELTIASNLAGSFGTRAKEAFKKEAERA